MIDLTWVTVQMLHSGLFVKLPSMVCPVNPICSPYWLHHSICASNWLRLILKSFSGGTHHYSLEKDHTVSWTDCRNSTPCIPRSKLCPTAAITNAFCFTAAGSAFNSQAFNWVDQKQLVKIFTYGSFVATLRIHLTSLGWFRPQETEAGNSFCRGGASFAYQANVPIKLIKALGDWLSDTILIIKQCL